MKKLNVLVAIAMAAMLTACGGGGGSDSSTQQQAEDGFNSQPMPVAPTVTAMTAPAVTSADCPRLTDETAAKAALDLSNPNIKLLNDLLPQYDPDHAYKVFLRRPADFVNWIVNGNGGKVDVVGVGLATHETLHMVDTVLRDCAPAGTYKTLQFGTILVSGLAPSSTANMSIVDGVLDPALKTGQRYTTYIQNAAAGNDFAVLLDEFSAYSGAAHVDFEMLAKAAPDSPRAQMDLNLGGTVNFMVFLEAYLKSAQTNAPATFDAIRNNAQTVALIQALWTRAEADLTESFIFTLNATPGLTVDLSYLKAAYSADLLAQLDALGVTHSSLATWSSTYLK